MPGFLDFLREALGTIGNAGNAVMQGQQSQNPLVAGLSGLAGVPFQALQMPQAVLGNYLEKFRAPGVENRLRQIQADQASASLATSPEGQAAQFNPPAGYTSAQGTRMPPGVRIPFNQLPPEHKNRLRLLAERMGQPTDDDSLALAWQGATSLPNNLPPPVNTKEAATIRAADANTAKDLAAAKLYGSGTVPPYPNMIPITSKDGHVTWGYPPAPVTVPGPGPADAPALDPRAPRPSATPAPAPRPTDARARAGQPFTYHDQATGQTVKGRFDADGMQGTAEDGSKWVLDPKTQAMIPVPAQQRPGTQAAPSAAPAPDASGGFDPNAQGADAADDMPALPGPRPEAAPTPGGAPSAAPAPAPAPAPAAPAPAAPTQGAAPAIPTPPGLPSAAPAPAVPAVPPPGGMPAPTAGAPAPGTAPATPPAATPAAPGADPEADAAEELLEPGASQRVGFPSGAPAEQATGTAAGGLAGQQLALATPNQIEGGIPGTDQRTLPGEYGGAPEQPATTPRGEVTGELEKPATFGWTWPDRYMIAVDHDPKLYDYVASRGFKTVKDARNDYHVQGMVHDWWQAEDLRVKAAQQEAATRGKANAAVQRQIGSIFALRSALDFAEKPITPGKQDSALDVPISTAWSNTSDWLDALRDELPIVGPATQETFSASGVGPPGNMGPRWASVRQMAKDPNHPWSRQAAKLLTLEGTSGLGVRSLGDVGTMTDHEKEIFAKAYLPRAADTPSYRHEKVRIVRELLGGIMQGMVDGTLNTPEKVRDYLRKSGVALDPGPGAYNPKAEDVERAPGPQGRTLTPPKAVAARRITRRVA